jgi:hypothetical protein
MELRGVVADVVFMMGPSLAEPECGVNRGMANIAFLPRLPV